MENYRHKFGLTLVEILIVVVIIAILAAMIISIAARIDIQTNKQLTESTFSLLDAALEQFRDYGYNYVNDPCFAGLDFPLDCNDFTDIDLQNTLQAAILGGPTVSVSGGAHDDTYSGSEAMYFFLSRVPESRQILERIDKFLITDKGSNGLDMKITIDGKAYPLYRVIDPWGETLRYSYYDNNIEISINEPPRASPRTFPIITSAGPDKEFGSADDIISR